MGARTRSAHVARGRPRQPPRDDRDPVRLPGVVLRRRPGDEPGHPENDHGVAARQHRQRLHGGRVLPVGRGRGGAGDRQGAQTGTWWGSLLSLVVFGAIALPAIRGVFWWAMAAPIASLPARWRTGLCPPNAGTPPASPPTPPCVGLLALLAVVGSIIRWVPYTGPGMPTGGRLAFAPVRDHARDPGSGRWALGAVVQRAQKWGRRVAGVRRFLPEPGGRRFAHQRSSRRASGGSTTPSPVASRVGWAQPWTTPGASTWPSSRATSGGRSSRRCGPTPAWRVGLRGCRGA